MRMLRWLFALAGIAFAGAAAAGRPLVIGAISSNPGGEVAAYHPLALHLAGRLKDLGVEGGRVTVVAGIPEMVALMKSGNADLVFETPFPTVEINRAAGSRPLLRQWKRGRSEYRSLILVRREHPARSLKDLAGGTIAFEDAHSTSAFLLPRAALGGERLRMRESVPGAKPAAGEVGYVFSRSQENSIVWVLRGRVDAAAVGSHDYDRVRAAEREGLRILHQSPDVPRQVVSVRSGLPDAVVQRIRETLLALEHSEEGRRILAGLSRTTKFDEFPEGADKALAPIERIARDLGGRVSR